MRPSRLTPRSLPHLPNWCGLQSIALVLGLLACIGCGSRALLTEREPGFLGAHLWLQDYRAMRGRVERLPDLYGRTSGLEGRKPIVTALTARALRFAEREREALAMLDLAAAFQAEPGSPSARAIGATATYLPGDRAGALAELRQLRRGHSDNIVVRSLYAAAFPFDLRAPTDPLNHHPTGYSLEKGELSMGFYGVGETKLGLPGGVALGTSTLNWIFKEPNLLAKIGLLREATVRPAPAIEARYVGNSEIEDSDRHSSQVRVMAAASKRVLPRVSLHGGFGTLGHAARLLAGSNLVRWDGRDADANVVEDGLYLVVVEAGGRRSPGPSRS